VSLPLPVGTAAAGFAGYEQMHDYVEADQDIGKLHVESIIGPQPSAERCPEPVMAASYRSSNVATAPPSCPGTTTPRRLPTVGGNDSSHTDSGGRRYKRVVVGAQGGESSSAVSAPNTR